MILAIAIITVVLIVLGAILGGIGMLNSYHDGQRHPSIVTKIVDWLF